MSLYECELLELTINVMKWGREALTLALAYPRRVGPDTGSYHHVSARTATERGVENGARMGSVPYLRTSIAVREELCPQRPSVTSEVTGAW